MNASVFRTALKIINDQIGDFFKQHKYIGSRETAELTELIRLRSQLRAAYDVYLQSVPVIMTADELEAHSANPLH